MEDKPKDYKKYEGIIVRKEINEKGGKGPKGWFYTKENDKEVKYTVWSSTTLDKFEEGDEVIITYFVQENAWGGKTYFNKTVERIEFKNKGQNELTEKNYEMLEEIGYKGQTPKARQIIKSENGVIKMAGLNYRIKDIEVELLVNGEDNL